VVVESLLDRTFHAAEFFDARAVGIAGGVAANSRLRDDALARGTRRELPVFLPSLALATDNAAMIGAAGLRRFRRGVESDLQFDADAALGIGE
jgi:N6-L-threonylcarbamoyladenine synthase